MGLLQSMFGVKSPPPPPRGIRDTLFGDAPMEQWGANGASAGSFPWSAFHEARLDWSRGSRDLAITKWRSVVECPGLESRHYLEAWQFLRTAGLEPPEAVAKRVLGVVVEVGMEGGLDLLAAYPEHTARYYNYSGSGVVWEHASTALDAQIDGLLEAGARVVQQIGRWEGPRPAAPGVNQVRLNFLTPRGLHFGQASMDVMEKDPIGAEVFHLAGQLMQAMIQLTSAGKA